jgi:hypothetical protein
MQTVLQRFQVSEVPVVTVALDQKTGVIEVVHYTPKLKSHADPHEDIEVEVEVDIDPAPTDIHPRFRKDYRGYTENFDSGEQNVRRPRDLQINAGRALKRRLN